MDLLVTIDDAKPVSTAELLEMVGEAEELAGAPVDFVLRSSLEESNNAFARENILRSASMSMEADQLGRLRDILDAARLIASYTQGCTEASLSRFDSLRSLVLM